MVFVIREFNITSSETSVPQCSTSDSFSVSVNIMGIIDGIGPEQAYKHKAPTYQELNFLVYLLINIIW